MHREYCLLVGATLDSGEKRRKFLVGGQSSRLLDAPQRRPPRRSDLPAPSRAGRRILATIKQRLERAAPDRGKLCSIFLFKGMFCLTKVQPNGNVTSFRVLGWAGPWN